MCNLDSTRHTNGSTDGDELNLSIPETAVEVIGILSRYDFILGTGVGRDIVLDIVVGVHLLFLAEETHLVLECIRLLWWMRR